MKTKNLIIYILICLIVIAGIAVWNAKGFNTELQFSSRKQIVLSNYTGIEISDIKSIVSEILGNTEYIIQPVETFGNSVSIVARDITEEQKTKIIEKFNEKYKTELKSDNIEIKSIPFTRIKDAINPFILPGIISLIIITLYFVVRYNKLGIVKILLKTILTPAVAELLVYSIMAIIRAPFGRVAIAVGIGVYVVCICVLAYMFEEQRKKYLESLESKE